MSKFANVGDFCPNKACRDYGKLQISQSKRNIKKHGLTENGTQRYYCKTCKQSFTATKGTIFYRRRTPVEEIVEVLAFLAEGVRISTLVRVKGHKEDTILDWLKEAGQHMETIESILMVNYQLERGQLDAMWLVIREKKRLSRNRRERSVLASNEAR